MMHKWESQEKLLSEYDNMTKEDIGESFVYSKFTYERDEFDNVPPVVLRFLFYLQMNFVPLNDHIRDSMKLQTTEELRFEMKSWIGEVLLDQKKDRESALVRE